MKLKELKQMMYISNFQICLLAFLGVMSSTLGQRFLGTSIGFYAGSTILIYANILASNWLIKDYGRFSDKNVKLYSTTAMVLIAAVVFMEFVI